MFTPMCTILPHFPPPSSYVPWKLLGAHVHKTTYGPLIDTALFVMFLIWANLLLRPFFHSSTFLGPNSSPFARAVSGLKKS